MDAMVTARMPEEKKRSGNRIIADAGKTPSGFIGEVYDYIIDEGKLPDLARTRAKDSDIESRRALFKKFIAETTLNVPSDFWTDDQGDELSDGQLLENALEEKYGHLR